VLALSNPRQLVKSDGEEVKVGPELGYETFDELEYKDAGIEVRTGLK
jgi:hypothetical protein